MERPAFVHLILLMREQIGTSRKVPRKHPIDDEATPKKPARKRPAEDTAEGEPPAKKAKTNVKRSHCDYGKHADKFDAAMASEPTSPEAQAVLARMLASNEHKQSLEQRRVLKTCGKCNLWCCSLCLPKGATKCAVCTLTE